MSERIVNDPSQHGWVEENGKWVWEGGATTGHIEDGTIDGQITTWDAAKGEWMPDGAVVVDSGSVGIGTDSPAKKLVISNNGVNGIEFEPDDAGRQSNAMLSYDRQAGAYTPFYFDCESYRFRTHSPSQPSISALIIDASGEASFSQRLGVGTPTGDVQAQLDVVRDNGTVAKFSSTVSGAYIGISDSATNSWWHQGIGVVGNDLKLKTANQDRLTIDYTGNATFSGIVQAAELRVPRASDGVGVGQIRPLDDYDFEIVNNGGSGCGIEFKSTGHVIARGDSASTLTVRRRDGTAGNCSVYYDAPQPFWAGSSLFSRYTIATGADLSNNALMEVDTSGTVYATKFVGDGSGLTNLPSGGGGTTYSAGNGISLSGTTFSVAAGNGLSQQSSGLAMSGSYTGSFTASGDVTAYSDVRLKEDINTLDGSKVFDMRGVSFTKDGKAGSGVIAQELQKIAPELVHDDEEYLSVAYGNLVGYLIESVKMLKAEIEELKRGTAS